MNEHELWHKMCIYYLVVIKKYNRGDGLAVATNQREFFVNVSTRLSEVIRFQNQSQIYIPKWAMLTSNDWKHLCNMDSNFNTLRILYT